MLATKRDQPYSQVMNVVRCMLNFSLIKSQIRCIRGSLQIDHGSCCQDRPYLHDCQWGACPPNLTSNNSRSNWKPTIVNNLLLHVCMYICIYVCFSFKKKMNWFQWSSVWNWEMSLSESQTLTAQCCSMPLYESTRSPSGCTQCMMLSVRQCTVCVPQVNGSRQTSPFHPCAQTQRLWTWATNNLHRLQRYTTNR